ncbi:MAG: hypothetical protein NT178_18485 [Proteobacteria bacterium]|nr:hypothetical protein [Pseudomonadota bacterium]
MKESNDIDWKIEVLRCVFRCESIENGDPIAKSLIPILSKRCLSLQIKDCGFYPKNWIPDPNWDRFICVKFTEKKGKYERKVFESSDLDSLGIGYNTKEIETLIDIWWVQNGNEFKPETSFDDFKNELDSWNDSKPDFIREIGRFSCLDSSLLVFLLLRRTEKSEAFSDLTSCKNCSFQLKMLSERINQAFGKEKVPEEIVLLGANNGDQKEEVDNFGYNLISDALDNIRYVLSLGTLTIRRWHHFLCFSSVKVGTNSYQYGWVLDPETFPNDITLCCCIPRIPRLLEQIFSLSQGISKKLPEDPKDPKTLLENNLCYALLFPMIYLNNPSKLTPSVPYDRGIKMQGADAGTVLKKLISHYDECYNESEKKKWCEELNAMLNDQWSNILKTSWSGSAMMRVYGGYHYPEEKPEEKSRADKLTGAIREFDESLPKDKLVFPIRWYPEQRLGFGLCCLSGKTRLFDPDLEESRYRVNQEYRIDANGKKTKLAFCSDILEVELSHIAEIAFMSVLGLSETVMAIARSLICEQAHRALSDDVIEWLTNILFPGIDAVFSRSRFVKLARQASSMSGKLANQLATFEVFSDYFREFGHAFTKHNLGSSDFYGEMLIPRDERYGLPKDLNPKKIKDRWHYLKFQKTGMITRQRIAGMQSGIDILAPKSSEHQRKSSGHHVTMRNLFDLFLTLPGMQMWTYLPEESDDLKLCGGKEAAYWRRLRLFAHRVPWHEESPLFIDILPGVIETILEVLVHNAFKHAAVYKGVDGKYVVNEESESAVRINVTFHICDLENNHRAAGILFWDNKPHGIQGELRNYINHKLPFEIYQTKTPGIAGKEEGAGQGIRVMMRTLQAQRGYVQDRELRLYLLGHDGITEPDKIAEDGTWKSAAQAVIEDLKTLQKEVNASEKILDMPLPTNGEETQVAFLLLQNCELQSLTGPTVPQEPIDGYKVVIYDANPASDDRERYRLFGVNKPEAIHESFFEECKHHNSLPHAIILHTARAKYNEKEIEEWCKQANEVYQSGSQRILVWLISEDPRLYNIGVQYGFRGTYHQEFRDWCDQTLKKDNLDEKDVIENKKKIVFDLAGPGRIERTKRDFGKCHNFFFQHFGNDFLSRKPYDPEEIHDALEFVDLFTGQSLTFDPSLKWLAIDWILGKIDAIYGNTFQETSKILGMKWRLTQERLMKDKEFLEQLFPTS